MGAWTLGFDFMCLLFPLLHLLSWHDAELSKIVEDRFKDGGVGGGQILLSFYCLQPTKSE